MKKQDAKHDVVPKYDELINPTLKALQRLGGSGKNDEIYDEVVKLLKLPDKVLDVPHGKGGSNELDYRLRWARTYLKNYGAINNSDRAIWSLNSDYLSMEKLDINEVKQAIRNKFSEKEKNQTQISELNFEVDTQDIPAERPWRKKLYDVLINMNAFAFERLAQRLLRECGFTQVSVTKKSNDGGIDGTGKFKINGVFSFNVAFQCKRYKADNLIDASAIRDFRGSLTTDIEKGIFITTSTFSQAAKKEASKPGKQQIDLMDGEEFIDKLAELGLGVKEIKEYEVFDAFFDNI